MPRWSHAGHTVAETGPVLTLAVIIGTVPALLGLSPLLISAAVGLVVGGVWLSTRPDAALRAALVAVLLPPGLLPVVVQSALDAGSVALACFAALNAPRSRQPWRTLPAALWLLGAYVVWNLLVLTWTPDVSAGVDLLRRHAVALALLVLVVVRTRDRAVLDGLLDTLAAVAWFLVLLALLAVATGQQTPGGSLALLDMNPNQLGNTLLLLLPAVLWRAVDPVRASRARQVQAAVFLTASLVAISQTDSRGSLLAFGALLVSFCATRTLRQWGVASLIVGLLLVLAAPGLFATVLDRLRTDDPEELHRTLLWSAAMSVIEEHPLGVGLGAGPGVMPAAVDRTVGHDLVAGREQIAAHNPVVEVTLDTGVIGGALFVGALVAGAVAAGVAVRAGHRRGNPSALVYGTVVGTCSVAFISVWLKSGGEAYAFNTFILLSLWLVPAQALSGSDT